MGILSNLIKKVGSSNIGQKIFKPGGAVDIITKPIQAVGVVVSNPITTITQGYGAAKQKVLNESVEKSIGKVAINTAIAGATVLTAGTAVGRTAAVTVAKKLTPTTPKGVITTAIAAPIAVGVLSETKKPITALTKAPGELATFGKDIGKVIESPTTENLGNLVKESPLLTAATGGLLLGGTIKTAVGVGNIISNVQTKEAVQDLINKEQPLPTAGTTVVSETKQPLLTEQKPFSAPTAVTPATAPLPSSSVKRPSRKRKSKLPTNISQRVNVVVQNKNTANSAKQTKNYLKRSILA